MIKVKIFGVTNAEEARWGANFGADYIGLNFYSQSPRKMSAKHAKENASQIPPFVKTVGVFVDEPIESLTKLVKSVPLKAVQLHGGETPDYCRQVKALGVTVIKVLSVEKPLEASDTSPYAESVDFFMFD